MGLRSWMADVRRRLAPQNAADTSNLTIEEFSRLLDGYGVLSTGSGIAVTAETAARSIAAKACCTLIAGGIVSMPLRILRLEMDGGRFVQYPADDHAYWWLLNRSPNDDEPAALMWQRVVWDLELRARAFIRIIRDSRNIGVRALRYIPRRDVVVEERWDPVRREKRILSYTCTVDGHTFGVLPEDMLDFRGERAYSGADHSAILEAARESIGVALSIEQYAGRTFMNGGTPRTILEFQPGTTLTEAQQQALREAFVRRYGGFENTALPLVLMGGKASKLNWTAEELQMLESWKFQVINIARAFNVPPFMIGETEKTSSWGSGIESMSKGFVRYTLGPIITAIEQEIERKLFPRAKFFADFDEEALDRGDMKSLGEWFRQAIGGSQGPGFMVVNEVRRRMNLPPIAGGGDELFNPNKGSKNEPTPPAPGQ